MQGSVTRLYTENIDIKFHNTLTITITHTHTHTHTHTPEVLINTQEQQEKSQIALRSRLFGYLNRCACHAHENVLKNKLALFFVYQQHRD